MIAPKYQDTLYIGADYSLSFFMKNKDGSIVDLSGASFLARFKYKIDDVDFVALTVTVDLPTAKVTASLSRTLTATLLPGTGHYDIVMQDTALLLTPILLVDLVVKASTTVP